MTGVVRIAMWSGPRNISTAMMRAWENRADCAVMDEPFYAAFLAETGRPDPMRDAVLAAHETGWAACARACATAAPAPVVFQKHMVSHMIPAAPTEWMAACRHAFLIRPPEEVIPSFRRGFPGSDLADFGFDRQAALFEEIRRLTGRAPPVVAARDVQARPEASLRALCAALGVAFDAAMLSWPAGPRESDGVWAEHWYAGVRASTGFAPPRPPEAVAEALAPLVTACRPAYEALAARAIRP